jgi:cell wall-associated NlpC family hydrolase
VLRGCGSVRATIRSSPSHDAVAVSELLHGEAFALVDTSGDWGWGYGIHDGYVGYLPCSIFADPIVATHRVATPAALVFARPDIKSRVVARLPMGAQVAGVADEAGFVTTAVGSIHHRHLVAVAEVAPDPVEIATRLVGTPYRWGGRSGDGIDCSGLVQLALGFCGIAAPRDSDQQRALGDEVPADAPLQRGDLIFLPGHVGMMADAHRLLHANAHWMATVCEPLADVVARQPAERGIVARRRLAW